MTARAMGHTATGVGADGTRTVELEVWHDDTDSYSRSVDPAAYALGPFLPQLPRILVSRRCPLLRAHRTAGAAWQRPGAVRFRRSVPGDPMMAGDRVTVPVRRGSGPVVRVPATVTDSRLTRESETWCTAHPDRGPVLECRRDQLEPAAVEVTHTGYRGPYVSRLCRRHADILPARIYPDTVTGEVPL